MAALPETRLAIIPGAGGTFRLPRLVGLGRARDMVLTGRLVSAEEAGRMGLADVLVGVEGEGSDRRSAEKPKDAPIDIEWMRGTKGMRMDRRVLDKALEIAKEICEGGPVAIREALRAVNGWQIDGEEHRAYEEVLKTEDRVEALNAWFDKHDGKRRPPKFRGE